MPDICGWVGDVREPWQGALAAMLAPLTRFGKSSASMTGGAGYAIAAAGLSGTAAVADEGEVIVALAGHPLWKGATYLTPIDTLATHFVPAYLRDGPQALRQLGGDFAIALIQPKAGRALLAVDRMGVRNLVYKADHTTLIFAGTCDALRVHPDAGSTLDPQAIYNYVYFHMVPGPGTVFREQHRLLPGHYVLFEGGVARTAPYWEMRFEENTGRVGDPDLQRNFVDSLRGAVAAFATPTEQCATFLSGGTDSSTVTGLLSQVQNGAARSYSIGFSADGYDEMSYARIAAQHFHSDHHEYYVTPDDVVAAIPKVAEICDQPFGNASAVPTYHCARVAGQDGIVRMLAGDGGDELFGGNARYAKQSQLARYDRIPLLVRRALLEPTMRAVPQNWGPQFVRKAKSYAAQGSVPLPARYESYNLLERVGPEAVFTPEFLASVDRREPHVLIAEWYQSARANHWLNRLLALDLKFTLADNDLVKVTRMCELAGVDVAFPMLHEAVVALSGKLRPEQKVRGTQLRPFFKESLQGFLPPETLAKEKHGFGLPVGPWLSSHAPLQTLTKDALFSLGNRKIVRSDFVDSLLAHYLPLHPAYYGTMAWILLMLELWFQKSARQA